MIGTMIAVASTATPMAIKLGRQPMATTINPSKGISASWPPELPEVAMLVASPSLLSK